MTDSSVLEIKEISSDRAREMFLQPLMTTMQWATFEFAIRLISPLMMDRMTPLQVQSLITGKKYESPQDEDLKTKASRKIYSTSYGEGELPNGLIVVPRENLYAALRDAGEVVQWGSGKHDRITMSTKGTELFSMIRLREESFPVLGLDGNPANWEVDLRKGNATQGVGAVGIVRPRFDEGGLVGHIDLNINSKLSEEKLRELFSVAGIRQGLCSARPANKMPFGQFALTHLKWIGGADPKARTSIVLSGNGTQPANCDETKKRGRKSKKAAVDTDPANRISEHLNPAEGNGEDKNLEGEQH